MGQPIAVTQGTCFAFPDMLKTPLAPSGSVVLPYPNIAQLSEATNTASSVIAGGKPVITEASRIENSSGGEAGSLGGVTSNVNLKACTFTGFSATVKANGKRVVRQGDATSQNNQNAVGTVLAGIPTVLVGG